MSTVGELVTQFPPIPCGVFLLCVTQKTIVSLTSPSTKMFLHPALKAKSFLFLQDVFVYWELDILFKLLAFFTEVIIYLEYWLPPPSFPHKSSLFLVCSFAETVQVCFFSLPQEYIQLIIARAPVFFSLKNQNNSQLGMC